VCTAGEKSRKTGGANMQVQVTMPSTATRSAGGPMRGKLAWRGDGVEKERVTVYA